MSSQIAVTAAEKPVVFIALALNNSDLCKQTAEDLSSAMPKTVRGKSVCLSETVLHQYKQLNALMSAYRFLASCLTTFKHCIMITDSEELFNVFLKADNFDELKHLVKSFRMKSWRSITIATISDPNEIRSVVESWLRVVSKLLDMEMKWRLAPRICDVTELPDGDPLAYLSDAVELLFERDIDDTSI